MTSASERLEQNAGGMRAFDARTSEDLRLALRVLDAAVQVRNVSAVLTAALDALEAEDVQPKALCICPHFRDTGGFRIADLTCPVHGVNGTEPGDGPWE